MSARHPSTLRALVLAIIAIAVIGFPVPGSSVGHAAGNDNTPWTYPTRPARCTSKQMTAGTVANCLVSGGRDEADGNGWPMAPFPSDPASGSDVAVIPMPGWRFGGFGYNGSPALAEWEAMMIGNQLSIGPLKPNTLRSMPDALPLFEGFLRDIVAGGYRITDAGMYSFRCTSGSGKSCAGQTRDSLSNHSWGLAMDMNAGANPEMTYVGVDGGSACAVPVKTDLPHWVIQTAEKWGLYWGGYGWNNGCTSPDEVKPTATRDSTHFEFRGSPAQARAIVAVNYGGSCLSAADDAGTISPRCLAPGAVPGQGWRVVVDTKAPAGATAALVNITLTDAAAPGFVTAEGCGAAPGGARTSSNGNATPGRTVANLAIVPIDSSGRFCLYRSQPMHTIVDVQGYFAPAKSAGNKAALYNAVAPQRVMDTRSSSFCAADGRCNDVGPVRGGDEMAVTTAMLPSTAVAALANLTVTEPAEAGYMTADTCSALAPGPQTHSNANFGAGQTLANLAVVPVEAGASGPQFCTYATTQTQTIVDVQGYFAPVSPTGWGYTATATQRLMDTRSCWTDSSSGTQRCAQLNDAGSIVRLKAPAGASAVLINLTLTDATSDGYATAVPCSLAAGATGQSNGNISVGAVAANLAVVTVDPDGSFCVRVSAPMHVIVDLQGTFSPTGELRFMPAAPTRRSDTRNPGG